MFKKLLVNIPTERSPRPVIDGAISLAARLQAQLDAVSVGHEIPNMPFLAEGGAAVATISKVEHEKALERARAALGVFEAEARRAGVAYSCRAITELQAEAAAILGATARLYDLSVVAQPEFEGTFDNTLAQEILFQSGGPVLFMPHTFRGAFDAGRIGICWDGSRLAARAVRDAMPLLEQAETITILTVNESRSVPADASAAHLVRYLARLGVPTRIAGVTTETANIQSSILSIAADESINLLVMGGYGHSRLKETVFGGVTREMLESMTVPTLMSH